MTGNQMARTFEARHDFAAILLGDWATIGERAAGVFTVGRGNFAGAIKLGMTGQVEIITDRRTVLTVLLRRIRSSISLG